MEELISIIIPVYNVENYVEKCIQSVVNQTYKNLEIIIVNDGTEDNSMDKIKTYIKNDKRIKVINQRNKGISAARNNGLENMTGQYVAFIDSDDFIDKTMIEKMYKRIKQDNSDISMCNMQRINFETNEEVPFNENYEEDQECFNNEEAMSALLLNKINGYSCNKLYKSSLFKEIRYKEGIIFEDIFVTFETIKIATKVSAIKEKLYFYTLRSGSITTNMKKKGIIDLNSRITYIESRIDTAKFNKEFSRFYLFIYLMTLDWIYHYRHDKKIKTEDKEFNEILHQKRRLKDMNIIKNQYVTVKEKIKYILIRVNLLDFIYKVKYILI